MYIMHASARSLMRTQEPCVHSTRRKDSGTEQCVNTHLHVLFCARALADPGTFAVFVDRLRISEAGTVEGCALWSLRAVSATTLSFTDMSGGNFSSLGTV